jgi:ferrous iron transport protein B
LSIAKPNLHKNKVAIVGNPNVGKSALFNQLTRSYSLVANFPHTTITVSRAEITIGGNKFEVIDTPGIISLDMQSEDGLITREILVREHPELIILCLDSTNIKRSLLLACQIFELDIPVVICLNLIDEARQKGVYINREKLEKLLGVPVVETVASEGRGIKQLIRQIPEAGLVQKKIQYKAFIEKGLRDIAACFPPPATPADAILLLLIQKDPLIQQYIRAQHGDEIANKIEHIIEKMQRATQKPLARMVFEKRAAWAEKISQAITEGRQRFTGRTGEFIGALCRHPFWGWIILSVIVYGTYILVGKVGTGILAAFLEQKIFMPINGAIGSMIPWDDGRAFLVGHYGILTTGFANAMGTVLPVLVIFFLILNVLEDIGYIANLCVLSNRVFQRLGLSGRAVLPIILGFGCKTMATLATKILDSRKERYIAVFLIAFAIPCSPLIGVNLAILTLFPFSTFLLVFGILVLMEIVVGLLLNKLLKQDGVSDFILEIPPIRVPLMKNLILKTYFRVKWFLIEAVPLFMVGAAMLFVMDKLHLLNIIKLGVFPVLVSFLNLPVQVVDAFLLSLSRKEAGAVILLNLAQQRQLDYVQATVGIIVLTCFFPCFANIMAMVKELGTRSALLMLLVIMLVSVIIGGMLNVILRIVF